MNTSSGRVSWSAKSAPTASYRPKKKNCFLRSKNTSIRTKFYELLIQYRHFLQIRLRDSDHRIISQFIEAYNLDYPRSIQINQQMHTATQDIVGQHTQNNAESRHREQWITEIFKDESLDGKNRYMALIRLIFIGFNYRETVPITVPNDPSEIMTKKKETSLDKMDLNFPCAKRTNLAKGE